VVGDVEAERRAAAFVVAEQLSVQPDLGLIVHGTELEQHATSRPAGRDADRPPVPHPRMKRRIADAALRALEGKRHGDGAVEPLARRVPPFVQADILVVEGKLPGPVEALPVSPLELRLRKLGARDGRLRQRGRGGHETEDESEHGRKGPPVDPAALKEPRDLMHGAKVSTGRVRWAASDGRWTVDGRPWTVDGRGSTVNGIILICPSS
jgi:hypothetical protein